jgi:hypothetical protein
MMRPLGKSLLLFGLAIIVISVTAWSLLGANTAWTKTYIEIPRTDEITGIAYTEKINRFVPGIDTLIPSIGAGFICVFSGLLILKRKSKINL